MTTEAFFDRFDPETLRDLPEPPAQEDVTQETWAETSLPLPDQTTAPLPRSGPADDNAP